MLYLLTCWLLLLSSINFIPFQSLSFHLLAVVAVNPFPEFQSILCLGQV